MKKIICSLLIALMVFAMVPATVFAAGNENAVYISYNNGNNKNDGYSADSSKKSLGSSGGDGAMGLLQSGGVLVVSEKLHIGASYTWSTRGPVTITANYDGVDYKNTEPATNPKSGSMKFASGATLTITSEVTLDDLILFQEGAQNTIIVADGGYLVVTENIVTMSKQKYFMKIVVEKGGEAVINGGTFSAVEGDGTIKIGEKATILSEGSTGSGNDQPAVAASDVCFLDYGGNNTNSGLSDSEPKKGLGGGAFSVLKNGGTIVVVGKAYIAGTADANEYSLPAFSNPLTFTSVWNGKDYKNPEPAKNPACAFKMGSATVFHVSSDLIFDNIILFQENSQNTIHVKSGATLTITDTVEFLSKPGLDYHYKLVLDEGSVAILSAEAQSTLEIEGNGTVIPYVSEGGTTPDTPAQPGTVVKMTIGATAGYVNGEEKPLDAAPIIRNERTMLPVRFVAEAFGATVAWDGATSTATIKSDSVEIQITIGKASAIVNGKTVFLDVPAFIENGRTYMPVRFVAESLGATVAWDGATSTATLSK